MTNTQPPTQEDDETLIAAMSDLEGWLRNVKDLPASAEVVARSAERLRSLALFSPPAGVVEGPAHALAYLLKRKLERHDVIDADAIDDCLTLATVRPEINDEDREWARQALSALEGMGASQAQDQPSAATPNGDPIQVQP